MTGLPVAVAVFWSCVPATFFVANLYLWVPPDLQSLTRNHPNVIRFRLYRVMVTCALSMLLVAGFQATGIAPNGWRSSWLAWLGLDIAGDIRTTLKSCINSILLTGILFLGPLVQTAITGERLLDAGWRAPLFWRNYVVVRGDRMLRFCIK